MWGMLGAWANALAMGAAAVFAFLAWRSDRGSAATARVDAFIVSLTTGSIAVARDRVTAWVQKRQGQKPPANVRIGTPDCPLCRVAVTDDEVQEVRHEVFEILWLLQRCSGLIRDLRKTDEASREVVLQHVSLIVEALNSFGHKLSGEQKVAFKDSVSLASRAMAKLKEEFPTLVDGKVWESALTDLTAAVVVTACSSV